MTDPPVFTKIDADRILRLAAEFEGAGTSGSLSASEVRAIAREVGFGSEAVERAISEVQDATAAGTRAPPVQTWGVFIVNLSAIRKLPIEISSEELMQAVRLFQPYRDGPAKIQLDQHEVTWRDRKGIRFAMRSEGGVTEIRVYVRKVMIRRGRWKRWVGAAADRLEKMVRLVAAEVGE